MLKKQIAHQYLERDISWMYFNHRILIEASKKNLPILERLNFLGIYSNNLDEFFRVRVATLNRIADCTEFAFREERQKALQTLKAITKLNKQYSSQFETMFNEILEELKEKDVYIINEKQLSKEQEKFIQNLYDTKLCGSTNPAYLSALKELDDHPDEDIYLAIKLGVSSPLGERVKTYAVMGLPTKEFGRFIRLPDEDGKTFFIFLDDVIRFCLPMVFSGLGYDQYEAYTFKFTRDAEMDLDNDLSSSTFQKVSEGISNRRRGEAIRFIYDGLMPNYLLKKIYQKLELDKMDTRVTGGRYHNMKDLIGFPDCGNKDLKYPPMPPIRNPELNPSNSLIAQIRKKDRFLHFPYHSFDSYVRLLREAALSKEVKTIKTTVYRLANDSNVVKALICASENGKKVTVVIELLARFDEASNIYWSKKMQAAGIKVVFGVEGLKTHSKITYIGTRNKDIACVSTGNFHEGNARIYTDYMLMTVNSALTSEVKNVFEFIEKPYKPFSFKELLVSPNDMKLGIIALINKEIRNKKNGKEAWILVKVNHITDIEIIDSLYEAAEVGVKIDLLVRGNCSLVLNSRPLKENIRISAIIDRYLEHARIFIFASGGKEKYFIGSADWMPRNLDSRVEVLIPIYDSDIQKDLKTVVKYGMKDNEQAFIVDGEGENKRWDTKGNVPFRSQQALYLHYLNLAKVFEEKRKKEEAKAEKNSA